MYRIVFSAPEPRPSFDSGLVAMDSFTGSSAGFSGRNSSRPYSDMEITCLRLTPYRRSQPARLAMDLHRGLLIFMLFICLAPVSILAQHATTISDVVDIRSSSNPNGEIVMDDPLEGSSFPLHDTTHSQSEGIAIAQYNDDLRVQPRSTTVNSGTLTEMPSPFDTMSINFANATCVSFFRSFLSNSTIMSCHAVSLLLENSNSFFHTLTSAAATSHVLDVACAQPVSKCATIMSSLAVEMLQSENCGSDFNAGNGVVQGTYRDLMAYEPMYHATCLTNPHTQDYCLVDAVTNTTTPNDYNVYFMPLGSPLGANRLTCNQCLQATMKIFAHWATVDGQALDTTYLASAKNVNKMCGAGFANAHVTVGSYAVTSGSGLAVSMPDIRMGTLVMGMTLAAVLLEL